MGIGFVLLLWAVFFGCAAIPVAATLAVWSWRNQTRSVANHNYLRPLVASLLPFGLLVYAGTAFIVYAIWCGTARGVDPGLGDLWAVPVGTGYYFCMIDVTESGRLFKGTCDGVPLVAE